MNSNKNRLNSLTDEETKEKASDEQVSRLASGYAAAESSRISVEQAGRTFARPKSYTGNRNVYDSGSAKRSVKQEAFQNNSKVYDPYTGKELALTKADAKAKFGSEWQHHLAESDHIKPLENVVNETNSNRWLTTDDIKTTANSEENFAVVSRKYNNAKRSRTNEGTVTDDKYLKDKGIELTAEGKQTALDHGNSADHFIKKNLRNKSIKNMASTGNKAGIDAGIKAGGTAVTISSILNISAVIKGEKTPEEAVESIVREGGQAAATGYVMGGSLTVIAHSVSESSSKFVQALIKSNVPGKIVTAVSLTGSSLKKYLNGEISAEECILQIGENGLTSTVAGYSMVVGQSLIPIPVVGAAIGALVGTVVTSTCYNNLIDSIMNTEIEHQERLRIMEESKKIAQDYTTYRKELEIYLNSYFKDFKDCFEDALADLKTGFMSDNADLAIAGANKITKKLGGSVFYEDVESFKNFLLDDSVDSL